MKRLLVWCLTGLLVVSAISAQDALAQEKKVESKARKLNIPEKKALRASKAKIEKAAKRLAAHKLRPQVSLRYDALYTYDLKALRSTRLEVLGTLGKVPERILGAMAEMAKDPDYREAFASLKVIEFVADTDARGSSFDYESSAHLDGTKLVIKYAPLGHMHGGYERSIQRAF